MRILELIGKALQPVRAGEEKILDNSAIIASHQKNISVRSSAFKDNAHMPIDYSADGAGLFPPIHWSGVTSGTQSLTLIIEDPDIPKPTPFVHGIFYNIPANITEITEKDVTKTGVSANLQSQGVKLGTNTLSQAVYMPPTPPPGHGPHHYHFQLIALDKKLDFSKTPTLDDIKKAIQDHVIGYGELIGIYER